MTDEADTDDNTQDLTVYDLAEKMAAGRILTVSAQFEVADELVRIEDEIKRLYETNAAWRKTAGDFAPREWSKELLRLRAELEKLLAPEAKS